jgi:hypothetical protein
MCNINDWYTCCCGPNCCIECGYACEECKDSCSKNCCDCIHECRRSCCEEIRCCHIYSGQECGGACASGCKHALTVFECISKIPSFMIGIILLICIFYAYLIWMYMMDKAQEINESLDTLRIASNTVNATLRSVLNG